MSKLLEELGQKKPFATLEDEVFVNVLKTAEDFLRREAELLKPYELTPSQYNVLRILRGAGADGLICREIGERMIARDPDVTKLIDRLEGRGFVTRERQEKDRRVIVIRITDEALKTLAEIDRPVLELTSGLLGHLGERRLKNLNSLLEAAREKAS
ncbi:MAG TPA: MarR family transcriptional regulator [Pyrinomonadaceae bacterium]|jgi:DNA-binding MarR family transcriptional regulator|nr:MarR family transcriptional regulator [Pyrinomonadaceae bacterium]